MDEHVAPIWFIDGAWRPVYEGADGRQHVIDGNGMKVYGVWFYRPGEPRPNVIVNALASLLNYYPRGIGSRPALPPRSPLH